MSYGPSETDAWIATAVLEKEMRVRLTDWVALYGRALGRVLAAGPGDGSSRGGSNSALETEGNRACDIN